VLYTIIFGDHSSKLDIQADRTTISTVAFGPFLEFVTITGTVVPVHTYHLDAIEGGRVDSVFLQAGSYLEKGQRILKLVNTNLVMDIMYSEAELVQQTNNLRNTELAMAQQRLATKSQLLDLDNRIKRQKRTYENYTQLMERNLVAEQEFETVRDDFEFLLATRDLTLQTFEQDSMYREVQIEQLQANLRLMEENLKVVRQNQESLTLRAPISGHLTSLNAEVGQTKSRGERLGQIDVLDGFKVLLPVDEHYITRVSVGQRGEFTYADSIYELVINRVLPEVVDGRFEVELGFTGRRPNDLRRGQTFRVRLELGELSEALLLPRGGFYEKTGGQWVFVVDPDGDVARKRFITLGRKSPLYYEVLDGLTAGERVITSSYDSYGDIDQLILK
jgi:HlyD family secretion protein